jgi:hypothetical protein
MNEGQLEYLKTHQDELGLKLLRHARFAATSYGWSGGKTLPLGKDPEDIVIEVVNDYLQERRHFNPKHDIEVQLKRAVKSELWALHQRIEAHAIPLEADDGEQSPRGYEADCIRPDEAATLLHDSEALFGFFQEHPVVKGDEELELLLMAIEEGAEDAPAMAKATGIPVKRIYEARKKLKTIWPSIMAKFNKGTEISL